MKRVFSLFFLVFFCVLLLCASLPAKEAIKPPTPSPVPLLGKDFDPEKSPLDCAAFLISAYKNVDAKEEAVADLASKYAETGQFEKARFFIKGIKDPYHKLDALKGLLSGFAKLENQKELLKVLLQSRDIALKEGDCFTAIKLSEIAEILFKFGFKEKATELIYLSMKSVLQNKEEGIDIVMGIAVILDVKTTPLGSESKIFPLLIKGVNKTFDICSRSRGYADLAYRYAGEGHKAEAELLLSYAVKDAEKLRKIDDKIITFREIADAYRMAGNRKKAIKMYSKTLDFIKKQPRDKLSFSNFPEIAAGYESMGEAKKASYLLSQDIKAADSLKPSSIKAFALASLAEDYQRAGGSFSMISKILPQAVKLVKPLEYGRDKEEVLAKVARIYILAGEIKKSLEIAGMMDTHFSICGDSFPIVNLIFVDIAEKYLKDGFYGDALLTVDRISEPSRKAVTLAKIAEKYAQINRKDKASEILIQALQSAKEIHNYSPSDFFSYDSDAKASVLAEIGLAYANSGLEMDGKTREILHEIAETEESKK
ncbi:MAG: hypothetical protein V2A78_03430 [bacterium]